MLIWLKGAWAWLFRWRYSPTNPCRRFCKLCGQQQDQFEDARGTYWKNVGNLKLSKQSCSRGHDEY